MRKRLYTKKCNWQEWYRFIKSVYKHEYSQIQINSNQSYHFGLSVFSVWMMNFDFWNFKLDRLMSYFIKIIIVYICIYEITKKIKN